MWSESATRSQDDRVRQLSRASLRERGLAQARLSVPRADRTRVAETCKTRRNADICDACKSAHCAETRVNRPPPRVHGEEGVSGSSPEEGSARAPDCGAFSFRGTCSGCPAIFSCRRSVRQLRVHHSIGTIRIARSNELARLRCRAETAQPRLVQVLFERLDSSSTLPHQ